MSQPIFDQFQYTIVKPAFAAALQLGALDAFEMFVAADPPPPTALRSAAEPAFYVGVSVPVAAASPDAVLAVAERLRALGLPTLRASIAQVVAAWNAVLASPPSSRSLAAAFLTAYPLDDPRLSVSESGAVQMALFDHRLVDAPRPPTDAVTLTLTRGAVAGIALGGLAVAAALIAGVGWLCFRAGSRQAYESISQSAATTATTAATSGFEQHATDEVGDDEATTNATDRDATAVSAPENDGAIVNIQMASL